MTVQKTLDTLLRMPSLISYREAIDEIVGWAKTRYTDERGGLARTIDEDGRPSKARLFNDLGDYLPFFAYLGEREFCAKQLEDTRNITTGSGLLPPEFRYAGFPCVRSYEHTDLLLGLLDAYTLLPSEPLRDDVLRVARGVMKTYHPEGSYLSSWYFSSLHIRFPVFDFKDGMFIEIWTVLARQLNEPSFLEAAKRLAAHILTTTKQRGSVLVPDVMGTTMFGRLFVQTYFKKAAQRCTPIKYLANTLYGFLELYRETKDDVYKQFLEEARLAIEQQLCGPEGAVHIAQFTNGQAVQMHPAMLVQNFPMIDWAADCAYFLGDASFLDLAQKIIRPWLEDQNKTTGLIPQDLHGQTTDLDNLTDTAIACLKLHELTKDDRYRMAAERIVQGILKYHRQPERFGYALSVDIHSGDVVDPQRKMKFICLFLKLLIVLEQGKPIFGTELYELTKDR